MKNIVPLRITKPNLILLLLMLFSLQDISAQVSSSVISKATSEPLTECASVPMRVFGGLINVGNALLYLHECRDATKILEAVPKQFTILLSRDAQGKYLQKQARNLLSKNLDANLSARHFCPDLVNAYRDAEKGDRYDVEYRPGIGLELRLNHEVLAKCEDDKDTAQYFSIWFGEKPFNKGLKERLITQSLQKVSFSEDNH